MLDPTANGGSACATDRWRAGTSRGQRISPLVARLKPISSLTMLEVALRCGFQTVIAVAQVPRSGRPNEADATYFA